MNARSLSGINDVTSNGDVALTMNARSMSGINDTFGGGGDVFQAGNPNTFTGTNTFNTNRPTSTLATTPGSNDFITKSDGEALFTNNTGVALLAGGTEASPQTFTEFNKFDKLTKFELTRPKHIVPQGSPATTAVDADFITKQDGDEFYGALSGSARLAGGDVGDPQIFTGENRFEVSVEMEGDSTFSGANAFTSTNTFNTNRPTTTLTNAITSGMFITKDDAENRLENVILNGDLNVSSGVGANGKCILTLEADTDNSVEASVPQILFKQDGGYIFSGVGVNLLDPTNNRNELSIVNGVGGQGGITFYTGTDSGSQGSGTKGYKLTAERMKIEGNGIITKQNGAGSVSSPFRRSLFSNTFTTENVGSKWIKIATLPVSTGSTKDITKVVLTGGDWGIAPMIITAWFRNRGGFKYQYKKEGYNNYISLFARSVSGGAVDIWVFLDGTSAYAVANWDIDTIEAEVYNPSSQSSPPSAGSLLFDSNNSSYPPNLVTEQAGITGHSFKAGFNDITRFPPGAVDYVLGQLQTFKPDMIAFNYGNCYSASTGAFTAKIKGVYAFKFSAYTNETYNQYSRPTLFRNNVQYQTTGEKIATNGNQVYSNIYLDVFDFVSVKSSAGSLYLFSDSTHNQFCGHLIHAVI
jgi:hypothetical protein